jgi:hypothetical protein
MAARVCGFGFAIHLLEACKMFSSLRKEFGMLAIACLAVLPAVSLAQETQSDRDSDQSHQQDSDQRRSQLDRAEESADQDSRKGGSQTLGDDNRPANLDSRNYQNDDRDWADNSSSQDDDQAGLGVTLYESASGREGATIRRVHPNSPAEHMGLRPGDRITKINDNDVESYRDLIEEVRELEPGDNVQIEIERDGDSKTVGGELESRREALVFRGQRMQDRGRMADRRSGDNRWDQGRVAYNSDQSGDRQFSYEGGSQQNQQFRQQLNSLERQVNQLRRQIDQLRYSVDSRSNSQSQNYNRESQAGYSEYDSQDSRNRRTSYNQPSTQGSWSDGHRGQSTRGYNQFETERSPGGQTGEERLRPGSDTAGSND